MKKETKAPKEKQPSFFEELGSFMKPYNGKYAASVIISIISVLMSIGSYAFVGMIASMLFSETHDIKRIVAFALLAILCKILNAVLLNTSTHISHRAAYYTLRDIRDAISQKLLKLPMGYFEENGSGRIKTMMVDNIENMEKTLAHMLPELTANILAPLAFVVWMFFIDWRLALAAVVWIFLGFSVTGGMMSGYEEKYAGQIKAFKGMNQAVVEFISGIEVIKNFGRADECYKKYEDAVYNHAKYNVDWMKSTQMYSSLGMAIAPFSVFPVLILGLYLFSKGTLEGGTLFLMVILSCGIFTPLMNAMNYFDQLAGMGTNAKEINDVLSYPELKRGEGAEAENSDVEFKDVSFTYSGAEKKAVDNISFKVPSGTMLALIGESGSGKSTIAKLLAGFWDAQSGEVKIGNHNISEYTQEEINSLIAFVDQDTFLFDKTIMDNIRLARPDASDEEVIENAKRAGCDEFIRKLPNGYMTEAGSAGSFLSGGEKQRISIARAMMKNAPIMILDEATASTDPENEASIQRSLSQAAKGKTLIVVAHRLQTVMNAQQIALIKSGKIEDIGTHESLLKTSESYAKMLKTAEGK